jgi:hypothetical protein
VAVGELKNKLEFAQSIASIVVVEEQYATKPRMTANVEIRALQSDENSICLHRVWIFPI